MIIIVGLALIIVAVVVCLLNPIRVALKLSLKHKIAIIITAVLSVIVPLAPFSALISYILIIIDLKQGNYLDTNNPELKNRNIVSVVFYGLEGLILFLPVVVVGGSAMGIDIKCNLSILNFVGIGEKTLNVNGWEISLDEIIKRFAGSNGADAMVAMGFIALTVVAIGIIMNLLVKAPEITFFFNGVLQIVYIVVALIIASSCQDSKMVNTGLAVFLMPVIAVVFIFFNLGTHHYKNKQEILSMEGQ